MFQIPPQSPLVGTELHSLEVVFSVYGLCLSTTLFVNTWITVFQSAPYRVFFTVLLQHLLILFLLRSLYAELFLTFATWVSVRYLRVFSDPYLIVEFLLFDRFVGIFTDAVLTGRLRPIVVPTFYYILGFLAWLRALYTVFNPTNPPMSF
jgi:hypothetical protein